MVPSLLQSNLPHRLRVRLLLLTFLILLISCAAIPVRSNSSAVFQIVVMNADGTISSGTGWIPPGSCNHLVTAAHVVSGGQAMISFNDQILNLRTIKIGREKDLDIAVLMTPSIEGEFVSLCNSGISPLRWARHTPEPLSHLWFLGYPAIVRELFPGEATFLSPKPTFDPSVDTEGERFAVSAPSFLPGQSGSPLFNEQGELVGMMNGVVWTNRGPGAISFATPAQTIRKFLD